MCKCVFFEFGSNEYTFERDTSFVQDNGRHCVSLSAIEFLVRFFSFCWSTDQARFRRLSGDRPTFSGKERGLRSRKAVIESKGRLSHLGVSNGPIMNLKVLFARTAHKN